MSFWNSEQEKLKAMELLRDYVEDTGNQELTYDALRAWYYGTGRHKTYKRDWHTIERLLRKLAEGKILLRYRHRRTVVFVVPENPDPLFVHRAREAYQNAVFNRDYDTMNRVAKTLAKRLGIPEASAFRYLSKGV